MIKRIKILLTIPNFDTAGSGKVVYDLAKGLDKSKFDIHIACGNSKGSFFKEIESLNLPIHIIQTKTGYRPYISLLKRIRPIVRFLKAYEFDIVHSWQWSSDWTEAIASKMAGAKWIYTKKAMGYTSKHWKIKSFLADYIISINEEMQSYFPNKRSQKVIPLGIDTDYYKPKDSKSLAKTDFLIVTIANLVPVKGIEVLIEAIGLLKDRCVKLKIIGDHQSNYGSNLKKLVKDLNLESQISFEGKVMDVRPYLANADLYIIPTLNQGRREGMPMALVEAMSMGVAVLGSNISGINYVLKDFKDLLFEGGNPENLSELIRNMKSKDEEDRQRLGKELREYCLQNFTLNKFISAHEELYASILK